MKRVTMDKIINQRKQANDKLVKRLKELIDKFPDQRFGQILRNYGFISETRVKQKPGEWEQQKWTNEFSLEPVALLARVKKEMKRLK